MKLRLSVTEKQKLFIDAAESEVLFGGAAGGGKSYGQMVDTLLFALKYPGSKQLVLRRTFAELDKSLIRLALSIFPNKLYSFNSSSHTGKFINGSCVDFGYCATENDVYQYQSAEYDVIRFDELTHFTEAQYVYLISRVRGANSFPKQIKSSTNPGGVGHGWVKRRFVDASEAGKSFIGEDGMDRIFIPSLLDDNRFLAEGDPRYRERLLALPERERKALLYGDWNIFEGQYFTEWKRDTHVVSPFEIPKTWRKFRTVDYGLDRLACLWIAVSPEGSFFVYREYCESNLSISAAAKAIMERTPDSESIYATLAPPDLWSRSQETGKTKASLFSEYGINFTKTSNEREAGWLALKELITPGENGIPRLRIFSHCLEIIKCLPALLIDKIKCNDCSTEPHEITHAPDALRGFAIYYARPKAFSTKSMDSGYVGGLLFCRRGREKILKTQIRRTVMKKETKSKLKRLSFFKELYESAKSAYAEKCAELDTYMEQYLGSDLIDGSQEKACTVRNITYEMIESQVSSDIPPPKVDAACYSEKRDRNAKSIERLLLSVRDRLSYEEMNDIDERYTYIYGSSVWYAEWDNSEALGSEIGSVKLHCLSPKSFIPQPSIASVDDMEYCFLEFTAGVSEIERRYSVSCEEISLLDFDVDSAESEKDNARIVIAFYRDENGEIGRFVFSGNLILSDLPEYYKRKRKVCKICQKDASECGCGKNNFADINVDFEKINVSLISSELIKTTEIPYYTPKSFPIVIRKNTSCDERLFGQSDCKFLRPQQQAINKIESRILQKLLKAGITPIVPEDATISLNNTVFGQVIKMKPGESAQQYGKVDTTPDISQDIAEAERLYDQAKRTLGISDALMGISNSKNESGYARQLQISQATGRLESKRKMKHTAYADLDRIIFELYLAFADEPRALSYKDAYGRIHNAEFSRSDFIAFDEKSCSYYYDDAYLFSVDLNGGAEYQREALWQRNLENLTSGALGDPKNSITLLRYWQAQERAHYPHARENVEYFTLAVEEEKAKEAQLFGEIKA